jgi:hydrogenase maturation protease
VTRTLVLGIGNILLRDEGVGVRVIEAMRHLPLPEGIELLDGGTSGADLVDAVADRTKVIVIDAVRTDRKPGTILRFSADDLVREAEGTLSLHEFGLLETLTAARLLACAPKQVVIFGIQPKEIGTGLELSAEVAEVLPEVIELVLAEAQA